MKIDGGIGMREIRKVKITENGPYYVSGNVPLAKEMALVRDSDIPEEWKKGVEYPSQETYILCRCGGSGNKPYCDFTHVKTGFDGKETASRKKYMDVAERTSGPELDLTDAEALCAVAKFCHLAGGTWDNVLKSDEPGPRKITIDTSCNCPSGRLVVWDRKTGEPIEPDFEPSIRITEYPNAKVSGPIWLKGRIELESSDGSLYETRNRVTLCRCGKSDNKPFCDGTHVKVKFNDGDESLG
jgi:CDGSH-type Zn-finger protein